MYVCQAQRRPSRHHSIVACSGEARELLCFAHHCLDTCKEPLLSEVSVPMLAFMWDQGPCILKWQELVMITRCQDHDYAKSERPASSRAVELVDNRVVECIDKCSNSDSNSNSAALASR